MTFDKLPVGAKFRFLGPPGVHEKVGSHTYRVDSDMPRAEVTIPRPEFYLVEEVTAMTFDKLELGAMFRFSASLVVCQKISEREYYCGDPNGNGYRRSVRHADLTAVNPVEDSPYTIRSLTAGEWSVWNMGTLVHVAESAEAAGKWLDDELAYQMAEGEAGSPEEERFHQELLAAGLVKEIKPPRTTPLGERRLIQAQGKPVSEIIIEERD